MKEIFSIFVVFFGIALFVVFLGWLAWRSFRRSDDRPALVRKWIITAFLIWVMVKHVYPLVGRSQAEAITAVLFTTAICIIIGITWAPSWASILFGPLLSAFDGGVADGDPTPQYSVVEARRSRGQYGEALEEIRKQLERFPNDLRLQLMQAEIQAEHFNDLLAAEAVISRISCQDHPPASIAGAFHQLADWHLKFGNDPDSARVALERIIERYPDSQFSQIASQRIARLGTAMDQLLERRDPHRIQMGEYERDMGLRQSAGPEDIATENDRARELTEHLARHPLDHEAREELARIYAETEQRVDLAASMLETLINQPNQKPRDIIRWLNLAADFHVQLASDTASAERALKRIIEMFPDSAGAELAQRRLATLNHELNRNKKRQAIKLGVYQKDLGLKLRTPGDQ